MRVDITSTRKKYRVIYADPPWKFSSKEATGKNRGGGFRYVTVAFVWSKKTVNGKTVSNLAPWTLKNCELCLMGTRGRMVQYKQRNNVPQLVEAVRTRHSEKPEEVRRSIEALFGDVPRIELFARRRSPGWDYWGNEV